MTHDTLGSCPFSISHFINTKVITMVAHVSPISLSSSHAVATLPRRLTSGVTKLAPSDHAMLLSKQKWLQTHRIEPAQALARQRSNPGTIDATLVFAQEEAGTAVCVTASGLLLTCSHCVAESVDELRWDQVHWLLFTSGRVVAARTIVWDDRRDLALLLVMRASGQDPVSVFPHIGISSSSPKRNARLLCIGHPGSEDLEAPETGVQTHYDVLVLSAGKFCGLSEGQDPQDNSDIGALMHDCWTYWGHSGAPLVEQRTGLLVGLHSSWDDETAMRRGVAWEAVTAFLNEADRALLTHLQVLSDAGV